MKIKKWNRIQAIWHSVTARSLFLIIFTTVVLLLIETSSLFSVYFLEKQAVNNYKISIDYYIQQCDNSLSEIVNSMKQITTNRMIDNSYANMCYLDGLQFQIAKRAVQTRLSGYAQIQDYLAKLFVYVPEKEIYLTSLNVNPSIYKNLIMDIVENLPQSRVAWKIIRYQDAPYLVRCMKEETGYTVALVSVEQLFQDLFPKEEGMNYQVAVFEGKDGEEVYSYLDSGSEIQRKKNAESFTYSLKNADAVIRIYAERKTGRMRLSLDLILLTISIGIFLVGYNIYYQAQYLLHPMNQLRRGMEDFSSGKLDTQLPLSELSAEMLQLFTTFNDMTRQIRNLKIEVYESAFEKEKIYNDYIKVQVQPHFYANILNLIYGMSQYQDYQGIEKMTLHAGAYFRYLLGSKGSFVALRDEIEGMKHYLEIQKMRYEEYLEFSLDVPDKLMEQPIIPMLMQTFVANSIKHNITFVPVLEVKIHIQEKEEFLYLEIQDNGVGIKEEILKKINENTLEEEKGNHIGIRNVRARLKLFYDEQAEMRIESEGKGTKVCIVVPKLVEDKKL